MSIIADFEQKLSSQSGPSFGQWYAVDLHNHSPASNDFRGDRTTALDEMVNHLGKTVVDIVMFTDHQQLPERSFTEEIARRTGKTILRGAELNVFVDAWGKPPHKIGKEAFFHLLVGFNPEDPQDPDYWMSHLKRNCKVEEREINGSTISGYAESIDNICDVLREAGAIIIPAHLHTKSDAFKSRSIDDIFEDEEFLRLAKKQFTALEVTKLSTADFFDGNHEETGKLLKTCVRSSDAHEVASVGKRITYVQMEEPTFTELKAGLQMPFRVSLAEPNTPESYIIGLNIEGQFFQNFWLSLSPHCNAFIGVKGSGKTSVLECLRFALGVAVPESRREDVQAHLQNILGPSGIVRVLIKRKDGAKVLVKRSANRPESFQLAFEDGREEEVKNPDALMFPSYILGWHEIEQVATDPNIRQTYLDTIAGREQIRQLREEVDANANQVRYLHEQLTGRYSTFLSLHEQVKRLEDLRTGLQKLTDANLISLRDSYEMAVRHRDSIQELIHKLRESASNLDDRAKIFFMQTDEDVFKGESPLSEFANIAENILAKLRSDVDGFVEQHRGQLESAIADLEAKSSEIEEAFEQFAQTYSDAVAELSPEQQRLLETHRQVMNDTRALPRLLMDLEKEKGELEALLSKLIGICNDVADRLDKQTELRKEKVTELNHQLKGYGISLKVAPLARRSIFDYLSERHTTGAKIFNELNSFASSEQRHHRRLARAYESLREDLTKGFTLIFSSSEFMVYLTAFEEDDLHVGFEVGKPGEQYSPIDQLSAGQRCTAIFPLLLKLQEGPLIVDQPEDNLDNRHIADSIAPALLKDKKTRQIAFTSHNANLVVLTDAEQIVMFEGSGSTGAVHARGFLCTSESKICPEVISILDGGKKALKLRYQKYGTLYV